MIELDELEPSVALPKKVVKIDENSSPSRERKTEKVPMEIDPNDKASMENTTRSPLVLLKRWRYR